jgi:hypothetical protein
MYLICATDRSIADVELTTCNNISGPRGGVQSNHRFEIEQVDDGCQVMSSLRYIGTTRTVG